MKLAQFAYLFSIILFCSLLVAAVRASKDENRMLKNHKWVFVWIALLALPFTLVEYFALRWHAWAYYPEHTFNIQFGGELETFVFSAAVALVIARMTLLFASRIDRKDDASSTKKM